MKIKMDIVRILDTKDDKLIDMTIYYKKEKTMFHLFICYSNSKPPI